MAARRRSKRGAGERDNGSLQGDEKVAVFVGTFENKVDRKGRISVPASFRAALTGQAFQGIVVFPSGSEPAIEGCDMDFMEEQVLSKMEVNLLDRGAKKKTPEIFFKLKQLAFDGEGRVILPPEFRAQAGIEDQAIFVGAGKLFQIWSPDRLTAFLAAEQGGPS